MANADQLQAVSLVIDTAASNLWVSTENSDTCNADCPFHAYEIRSSSTAQMIDENAFRGALSDQMHFSGDLVTDVLHLPSVDTPAAFDFAQVDAASPFPGNASMPGVVGLGPSRGDFEVVTGSFLDHLLDLGVIHRPTFGLTLTGGNGTPQINFGEVDRARFEAPLHGFDMVDPKSYGIALKNIAPFHPDAAKRDHERTFEDSSLTVLVDAANPFLELPGHVVDQILDQYNGRYDNGTLTVPRYQLTDTQGLAFHFDGVEIRLPLNHLMYPASLPNRVSGQPALFRSVDETTPPEWDAHPDYPYPEEPKEYPKEEPYHPPAETTHWQPEPTYPPKTTEHSHKWKDWTTATETPAPKTTEHSHQWKDWKTVTWNVTVTNNQTWTVTAPCPTATAASTGGAWGNGHPQAQFDVAHVPLRIKKSRENTEIHRLGTPFLQHAYVVFDLWEDRVYIGRPTETVGSDTLSLPIQDEDEEKRLFSPPISRKNKKAWKREGGSAAASLRVSAMSTLCMVLLAVVMGSWRW
jgi:hypothetical protein